MKSDLKTTFQAVVLFLMTSAAIAAEVKPSPPEADIGGAPCRREEVFQFSQEPSFRKAGKDQYEIQFGSKGWCDVAVGIVDSSGRIIRHLATGVLGPNAPEPLKKDSLEQRLTWDGKNDLGRYVDAPESHRLRVSLGLKPTFDKPLISNPNRWTAMALTYPYGVACDKDRVYVMTTAIEFVSKLADPSSTQILAYDHDGNYQRTLLPIPRDKLKPQAYAPSVMHGQGSPRDGKPAGLDADSPPFGLVLATGETIVSPNKDGDFFKAMESNAFCVTDGLITAVNFILKGNELRLFRLKTDGTMPGDGYYSSLLGDRGGMGPCWLAVSPDRKWIYISGLGSRTRNAYKKCRWEYVVERRRDIAKHAVYRLPFDGKGKMELFLGQEDEPGGDNRHFQYPEGVACDKEGRIYVSDTSNDRVQVFQPDGKFVKSIPVIAPNQTAVHPETGAIYVISAPVKEGFFRLLKLDGLDALKTVAEQTFKVDPTGVPILPFLCLDPWARETTVWITHRGEAGPGPSGWGYDVNRVQLWIDRGNKFELKRDLYEDLKRDWKGVLVNDVPGNLAAAPHRPHLYLGDSRLGGPLFHRKRSYRIDTETGVAAITLGATQVGADGLLYIREGNAIYRYDPETEEPVAFDYGEGDDGYIGYRFSSEDGIGIGVSPWGDVLFHDRWPPVPGVMFRHEDLHIATQMHMRLPDYMTDPRFAKGATSIGGYNVRQMYPGRNYKGSSAILLYDRSGQLKKNDLIQGTTRVTSCLRMDLKGNVYVGIPEAKLVDGREIMGYSVVKFGPDGGRFVVNGPGVPIPLEDPPKRPADFRPKYGVHPMHDDKGPHGEQGYGDKTWAEGMLWSFGGYYPFNTTKCICLNARFEVDLYGRAFIPEGHRAAVSVLDPNGNFILRLGAYGNPDDRGPDIRFAYLRYLSVNDNRLYINDSTNQRILSVDLKYAQDRTVELK